MKPTPFLKEIAVHLLESGRYKFDETCIVFPNKRARIYLSKYLGELTAKPVWAPRYLTINELMEQLSGFVYADRLTLIFELFSVYKEITDSSESFDSFYPLCETILSDFDEIDKYMVDADDLFQNLSALKTMEGRFNYLSEEQIKAIQKFWDTFQPDQMTLDQETFLSVWKILPLLYNKYKDRLESTGIAYEGMAYRRVSDIIKESALFPSLIYKKYLFVGFNALNACEERLFRYLKNTGKAIFFYDYDTYYSNNTIHEAGYFIRKNLRDFQPELKVNNNNLLETKKRIVFLPVSSNTGQAKALPSLMKKMNIKPGSHSENTAIVLADEKLLLPVLYSLPSETDEINITMGYPVSETAAFSLVESLYELQRNARMNHEGIKEYYHRDVLSLINNPLLSDVFNNEEYDIRKEIGKIKQTYIRSDLMATFDSESMIFSNNNPVSNTADYLLKSFEFVIRKVLTSKNESYHVGNMQLEGLYQIYTFLTRLHDIVVNTEMESKGESLFKLARKYLRNHRIPFAGEPLAGLQVMGLLETRSIDFDNVIVLSANEGILPKSQHYNSFIPYSLRFGFGLSTMEHHDSMYAYYFYRLLQRAKKVVLLYNSSSDGLRTGECSRFLHQLRYEFPVKVEESAYVFNVSHIRLKKIVIEKKRDVSQLLDMYFDQDARILTPSAMNEFLNCSLKYYFHYITGLPPKDDIADMVDQKLFGNLLHKTMKILYGNMANKHADHKSIMNLLNKPGKIDHIIDMAFNEEVFGLTHDDPSAKIEGFNLVVKQILKKYILQLVKYDGTLSPFEIISLEEPFEVNHPVTVKGVQKEIRIGGIIDRIDRHKGSVRILDYKTGMVKNSFPGIDDLFNGKNREQYDAIFQVLYYALIYDRLFPGNQIIPGLIFIRESYQDGFSYAVKSGRKKEPVTFSQVAAGFQDLLTRNLNRIFDESEPFCQTDNLRICGYCSYSGICHR